VQVEKESDASSVLCAFYMADANIISQHLHQLSSYIRQCVVPEDHEKIFTYMDHSLSTNSRAIPIKKGNNHVSSRPVSDEIQHHTNFALSKIVVAPMKRTMASLNSQITKETASTLSTSPITVTAGSNSSHGASPAESRFRTIEQELVQSSNRMDKIEDLCIQLKHNTDVISTQITQLAVGISSANQPLPGPPPAKVAKTL